MTCPTQRPRIKFSVRFTDGATSVVQHPCMSESIVINWERRKPFRRVFRHLLIELRNKQKQLNDVRQQLQDEKQLLINDKRAPEMRKECEALERERQSWRNEVDRSERHCTLGEEFDGMSNC